MYFLYSEEEFFIERELNKFKQDFHQENIFIYRENYEINEILEQILFENLFEEKKLFIIYNLPYFSTTKLTEKNLQSIETFKKIFSKVLKNKVIFVLNQANYAKNEFTEFIKNTFQCLNFEKLSRLQVREQIKEYIKNKNCKISQSDLIYLLEKLPDNLSIILKEVDKITQSSSIIDIKVIDDFVFEYRINNPFALSNALETGDLGKIFSKFVERIKEGESEMVLLVQIFNIFSITENIYQYKKMMLSDNEIMFKLKLQDWRYRKFLNIIKLYGIEKIRNILLNLAILDLQLKSEGVGANVLFETFLVTNFS
ncbi:DNA polymerase III delta subunit [Mycoplasmopsis mustelae]|uniref:DNA-directed DNA polymerase n=1 Tax=Mycoplasmopsis mustelae TaxID=171289 RepID=A0A4R7UCM9_9BACT|nr:hypothetical protein [Mycoplasmopsis mustelae]TDV24177.1 DNA polymerase III delta subunit [Mycoplasmopsis mustelae]